MAFLCPAAVSRIVALLSDQPAGIGGEVLSDGRTQPERAKRGGKSTAGHSLGDLSPGVLCSHAPSELVELLIVHNTLHPHCEWRSSPMSCGYHAPRQHLNQSHPDDGD